MKRCGGALLLPAAIACMATISARVSAQSYTGGGFGVCVPRVERANRDVGCFIITDAHVGALGSTPMFWHITRFASPAAADSAAHASAPAGTTVFQAFDSTWMMTIAAEGWRATTGTPVASIGPLPITPGVSYAALYMEATMQPGMKSAIHRHSGPEAWYTLSGETCLESPAGRQVGRREEKPVIVPGGTAMQLTATGSTVRRALVLILHDSARPPTSMETTWKPADLCRR